MSAPAPWLSSSLRGDHRPVNALELAAAALGGYLVGAVSPAALLARSRHIDLRGLGSGNPGATNVGRILGVRWGVLVALLDVAKGFLPAVAFTLLSHEAGMLAGAAAVVGHVTSPFLRGRGGKGVAAAFGAVLGVEPFWALGLLVGFGVAVALSRWVALGSMTAAVMLVVIAVVTGAEPAEQVWAGFLALVILVRHRTNVIARWRARRVYG
jgi:acyl phosphate:glycerol-3-phosphate acyltransferase